MVGTTTAVVTGANSFVGTEIVAQLLHKGYTVRATVRDAANPSKTAHLEKLAKAFPGDLTFHEAELGAPGAFHRVIQGAYYVYHCASNLIDRDQTMPEQGMDVKQKIIEEAIKSQEDIIRAAAASKSTVKSIVVTSSMAAVKSFDAVRMKPWSEDDWNLLTDEQADKNTYEYIKTLTEKRSFELAQELGISLSSIVPSFVIGPVISDQLGFSPHLVKTVLEDKSMSPVWLATAVDVRDVARAHILAAERPGPGRRYLVARSHPLPPAELVDCLRETLPGYKIDEEGVARRGFYNPHFHIFDTSRVQRELGLHFTPVQESFVDMIISMLRMKMISLEPWETPVPAAEALDAKEPSESNDIAAALRAITV